MLIFFSKIMQLILIWCTFSGISPRIYANQNFIYADVSAASAKFSKSERRAAPDCPVELIGYTEDSVSYVGHDVGLGLQNNFIYRA